MKRNTATKVSPSDSREYIPRDLLNLLTTRQEGRYKTSQDNARRHGAFPPRILDPRETREKFWEKQETEETYQMRVEEKRNPETIEETADKIGRKENLRSSLRNCQ